MWYHTTYSRFSDWNPLQFSTWKGIGLLIQILERTPAFPSTVMSQAEHRQEHHKERANNQHLTADWVDFKIPVIWPLAEKYSNFCYDILKGLLQRKRGTFLPIALEDLYDVPTEKVHSEGFMRAHFMKVQEKYGIAADLLQQEI